MLCWISKSCTLRLSDRTTLLFNHIEYLFFQYFIYQLICWKLPWDAGFIFFKSTHIWNKELTFFMLLIENYQIYYYTEMKIKLIFVYLYYLRLHEYDFSNIYNVNFLVEYWNVIHTLPIYEKGVHDNHSNNFSWMI